jgi:hypothetical protein
MGTPEKRLAKEGGQEVREPVAARRCVGETEEEELMERYVPAVLAKLKGYALGYLEGMGLNGLVD